MMPALLTRTSTRPNWRVAFGEPFTLEIAFAIERGAAEPIIGVGFRNDRGEDVLTAHSSDGGLVIPERLTRGIARVTIEAPWLRPGTYYVEAAIVSGLQLLDYVADAAVLVVEENSAPGAPRLPLKKGPVSPVWRWHVD